MQLNFWIKKSQILELIDFIDDSDQKQAAIKRVHSIYRSMFFIGVLLIGLVFFLSLITFNSATLNTAEYVILIAAWLLFGLFFSSFSNYYIYLSAQIFTDGFLVKQFAVFTKVLKPADLEILTNFKTYFQGYFFKLSNVIINSVYVIFPIIAIVLGNLDQRAKIFFSITFMFMAIFIVFGGLIWIRVSASLRNSLESKKDLSRRQVTSRVMVPAIYNIVTGYSAITLVSLVTRIGLQEVYIQLMLFVSSISFGWGLVNTIEELGYAKSNLAKLNQRLEEIESKYVINNRSYKYLCELCKPSNELLRTSKLNKSLLLNKYIPMYYTNAEKVTHIYSYEFIPGVYQINGLNGIGKTTLLRSLTLPESILVEKSGGQVAFQGKPFFSEDGGLAGHRKKYKYICSRSVQDDVQTLNTELFYEFPVLKSALENFQDEKHTEHSEGEKGVISIASVYQECLNGVNEKILLIDESLSRIYGRADLPLRQEVIRLIELMSKIDDELIVMIVDHMTEVAFAKQLHITKHSISEI